ncbi:DNA phosphorothioation-dependent restriction protein DptF [Sporomusa termitida]|uniref:DNA phosphorothioation-dependent restriction protein DptF n=1 Tax=Sporomusa termitida TaxID=2377 RepID=A0A517DWR9_9FIRM|nr:DNA phosphorothioation-dependent restriction protein DptF [Sporomusa termitida]
MKEILTKTFLRMYLFKPKSTWLKLNDDIYLDYMQNLYWWNKGDKTKLKPLFDRIKESIYKWNGKSAPETINLFIGRNQLHYKISQRLSLSPVLNNLPQIPKNELHKFIPYLILEYKDFSKNTSYSISIDFSLYKLLMRIRKGYRPNRKDKNDFINFVEFIDKILKLGNQNKELFIEDRLENKRQFKLVFDSEFEQYSFEEMS